ncbi:MAG: hypothetical protein GY796_20225 [Chloroflexi bacterium]|nr:hypothetical protein [Chloroflexota bacterium]
MKRWLRRFAYLLFVIFWLMIICFPTFAFTLAMREQIQLGGNSGSHVRFFLVRGEDSDGIGLELARPMLSESNCTKISITYLFWEGRTADQNTSFCQCFDPQTRAPLPVKADSCR